MKYRKQIDFIEKLPLAIIAAVAGFSVVALALVLLEQFKVELIWSIGPFVALLFGVIVWIVPSKYDRPGSRKEWLWCDVLVLLGVLAWGAWNISITSQHIITDRDPATYAVASSWLAQHDSFRLESPNTYQDIDGIRLESAGFTMKQEGSQTVIHPQGQHVLPALLGAFGKFIGDVGILRLNVIFGVTALLAVYCLARVYARSYWALLATGIMAFSLPLLYFSRDTYTEPLALTFIIGGLALLAAAQQSKSKLLLWGVAGFVVGASLLARIDSYLALVGVAAFFVCYILLGKRQEDWLRMRQLLAFWLPVTLMGILAWLDLKLLSEKYYTLNKGLIGMEILAVTGILTLGIALLFVVRWYPNLLKWLQKVTKKWRAIAALSLVVLLGIVLMSRPLWFEASGREFEVASTIQQEQGEEVTPRTYAELTTYWVSWYVGPLISAIGLAGLAVAAFRSMNDKKMILLCGLFVIAGSSIVYLIMPTITPDQVWASRRLLPVIMPGIVIFGVYALSIGFERLNIRSRLVKVISITATSAVLLVAPLLTSHPFLDTPVKRQYQLADNVCEMLPEDSAVVMIGMARITFVQPVWTYCGVETYNYSWMREDKPSRKQLIEISKAAREKGKVPILGVYRDQYGGLIDEVSQPHLSETRTLIYSEITPTLDAPPSKITQKEVRLSLAIINTDGSLKRLEKELD